MSVDHRLIALLVCPVCKGPLALRRSIDEVPQSMDCPADHLSFPIRDGVPVLIEAEARSLDDAPLVR